MYEDLTTYLPMLESGEPCVEDDRIVVKGENGSIGIGATSTRHGHASS